jgi:Tfp pilus assembly protein PilF
MKKKISLFLVYIFISSLSFGQSFKHEQLDPYGFVTKYDTAFNGIGPEVYILPLPRTLKEEMTDTYEDLLSFEDSIHLIIIQKELLSSFQKTTNQEIITTISPDYINHSDSLVKHLVEQKKHPIVYALYNNLAMVYLGNNKTRDALEALEVALVHARLSNNPDDIAIIQSNMASVNLIIGEFEQASLLENNYLTHMQKQKQLRREATSHARIALIEAYQRNYQLAENLIIRKSIPLFNKSKFYDGKIDAWITLAEIYRSQNKHTQAQWFLIQARDLIQEGEVHNKLAIIEYMLGSAKMKQNNFKFARKELQSAWELAKDSKNQYLQLAIAEQLGRANVKLGNYEAAKEYLEHYWELRNNIF